MKEVWKDIAGYEGLYQISNMGRVKSCERYRINHSKPQRVPEKIKAPSTSHNGYYSVVLYKEGKGKGFRINRLVAEAFCDKPSDAMVVNHIDNNRKNNKADNLEWVTTKQNVAHTWKQGRGNTRKAIEARLSRRLLSNGN